MTSEVDLLTSGLTEVDAFVERALEDFSLKEAFESRSWQERASWLRWIAKAASIDDRELRVSELLDSLAGIAGIRPPGTEDG